MMKRIVSFLGILLSFVMFQNCGRAMGGSAGPPTPSPDQRIIVEPSNYNKVVYTAPQSGSQFGVDVDAGSLEFNGQNCNLNAARVAALKDILSGAQVCEPGDLPPGTAVCLALGVPDIELFDGSYTVQLRPVICHSGIFLCDGRDQKLRDLLLQVAADPASACSN
jgi:hypothetical protein